MSATIRASVYFSLNEGLWVVLVTPALVLFAGDDWWPGWAGPVLVVAGAVVFALGGGLSIWAGRHLVDRGGGTPFPVRPPQRLVTSGPYARVRNPQVLGGILAMIGVALATSEPVVWLLPVLFAIYALVILHTNERLTLQERFGAEYAEYRQSVAGWWPR